MGTITNDDGYFRVGTRDARDAIKAVDRVTNE